MNEGEKKKHKSYLNICAELFECPGFYQASFIGSVVTSQQHK